MKRVSAMVLRWSVFAGFGLVVVATAVGWVAGGVTGGMSALLGSAAALLFLGLTVVLVSIAAQRASDTPGVFFGVVLGGWLGKLILFGAVFAAIHFVPWINRSAFGLSVMAAVAVSLAVDVLAVRRARLPAISDPIPPADVPEHE